MKKTKFFVELGFPKSLKDIDFIYEFFNTQLGYEFSFHKFYVSNSWTAGMRIYFKSERDLAYFMLCCRDRFNDAPNPL